MKGKIIVHVKQFKIKNTKMNKYMIDTHSETFGGVS